MSNRFQGKIDENIFLNGNIFVYSYAFSNRLAVAILRMPKGLDYSHLNIEVNAFTPSGGGLTSSSSISNLTQLDNTSETNGKNKLTKTATEPTIMPADSYLNLTTLASPNGNENGNRQPGKTCERGDRSEISTLYRCDV